jgi:hypothetical protein
VVVVPGRSTYPEPLVVERRTTYPVAPGTALQLRLTRALPGTAVRLEGAAVGGAIGVAVAWADLRLVPPPFTAKTT